ncbi:MAG: glycosyltransferase family 39 protein [Endomicrobia bacterium]|nr:glycosyltransferase family 39 protein [Endomicrobiia bacterium]MCL2506499.1 glycosyltransferase family 39 protein [Endomicrobiia bacterium]
MEKIFNKKNTMLAVGASIVFKAFLSAFLELHPDEAYYWLWSKKLALGYYDHSPMVAYFIKITTIFSDAEIFVRLSSTIVAVILSVLMWKFVKKLFNETIAAASVIIVNTIPLMMAASFIITPDTPVFLFYAFTVYFLWRLVDSSETKYWYLTGVFFGLTLLSKYTGVLFAPCLLVYMILDKKLSWFKNKHFYLMFLTAFIVFLPVVIWNAQHGWISFTYQLGHGLYNTSLNIGYVFEYLGAQALVAGPVIFIAGFIAAYGYFVSKDSKKIFLASFSIPVILFFAFTALKRLPGANWPSFAYFTFCIMAAQYLLSDNSKVKRKILVIGILINVFLSIIVGLHAKYSIVPIYKFSQDAAVADATNWFSGWKVLGNKLVKRDVKYAVTNSHQWAGAIAYYTKGEVEVTLDSHRLNQFAYWEVPAGLGTEKTVVVKVDNKMRENFRDLKDAEVFFIDKNDIPIRQYAIIETNNKEQITEP